MWFIVILCIISAVYFLLRRKYEYWNERGIPGPQPTMFVGNIGPMFSMKRHFGELAEDWYNQYFDVPYFGYYKCFNPVLMIRDPDIIKDVMIKDFAHFAENDFGFNEKTDELLANNPFLVTGERWKTSRNLLSTIFSTSKVKSLYPLMETSCKRMTKYIEEKGARYDFDAKDLAAKFSTDNVANCGFSLDSESFTQPKSEFRQMGKLMFQPTKLVAIKFMIVLFIPSLLQYIPIPFLPSKLDKWIRNLVKNNIESRKRIKLGHDDMLQLLLKEREKFNLTETQLTGHSLTFFIEGFETSSALLSFAMYEMACNPEIQERAYDEVCDILTNNDDQLTFDALNEMTYLEGVLHETLRLRPAVFVMHKICTKEYQLPPLPGNTEGYLIPERMQIAVPVYPLHKDPLHYPEPNRFDPERHMGGEFRKRHKAVFMPFGEGPRICVGMKFALIQTKVALATVLKKFKITLSPNCKPFAIDPKPFMYQSLDPLLINLVKRE